MMNESCKNCGKVWQPNPKSFEKHYLCVQVERGNMSADTLWSKIQNNSKPHQCNEWCSKDEIGDSK